MSRLPPVINIKSLSPDTDVHPTRPVVDIATDEVNQVALDMVELFDNLFDPGIGDPLQYIDAAILRTVADSSASRQVKEKIHSKSRIAVRYIQGRPSSQAGLTGVGINPGKLKTRDFTLDEIVTDTYRHALKDDTEVRVLWPRDYPRDLIKALESANLQSDYRAEIEKRFTSPDGEYMVKLMMQVELENHMNAYGLRRGVSDGYQRMTQALERKELIMKTMEYRGASLVPVPQVLFLQHTGLAGTAPAGDGLLIFLDEPQDQAIYELIGGPAAQRVTIESSPQLQRKILERLPLYEQLKPGNDTVQYRKHRLGVNMVTLAPLTFHDTDDYVGELYVLKIERMLSDIDTLVSTDAERAVDKLLELGGFLLQALSIAVTLPTGAGTFAARMLASFLLGQGVAAVEAIRGSLADRPDKAREHYATAFITVIAEIAGPLAQKILGRVLSAASRSRVTAKVVKNLRNSRIGREAFKPAPQEVKRLKTALTAELAGGPQQAQTLVDSSVKLVEKPVEGHQLVIYHGHVFRGDTRPPQVIFEQGFELRTPAVDIKKDIHQVTGVRGGFGGGKDALDPDGKGISTSAFYLQDNTGAFVYGGGKGGHTYLIDARNLDGYHLYQNHHNALYPGAAPITFKPTEINYADSFPPNSILGAYDSLGQFIPNPVGLKKLARDQARKALRTRLETLAAAVSGKVRPGAASAVERVMLMP